MWSDLRSVRVTLCSYVSSRTHLFTLRWVHKCWKLGKHWHIQDSSVESQLWAKQHCSCWHWNVYGVMSSLTGSALLCVNCSDRWSNHTQKHCCDSRHRRHAVAALSRQYVSLSLVTGSFNNLSCWLSAVPTSSVVIKL